MGAARVGRPSRWSGWAWATIAVVTVFIAISCWWVSQDRGVPFADAGSHLYTVIAYHDLLSHRNVDAFFQRSGYYPPATFAIGALATFVGGVNASAPVIGENLVYLTLLALGCYGTGFLVAGPMAGFLAVLLVVGSPLLIEQMHVFMIDAPLAAMVAVSVWLILLSDRFRRIGVAAAAGAAAGVGMASKEQFPLFIFGLLLMVLLRRGGWRNWRGIAVFAGVAAVLALPWYIINLSQLGHYAAAAAGDPANIPPRGRPPLVSLSNLGWYFWAIMNGLLFAPLFAFAAVGVAHAARVVTRRRRGDENEQGLRLHGPELFAGLFGGWLAISLTPHHDMRYALPLLTYLGVLGTSWVVTLRRSEMRALATAALAAAVVATTLGASFGVGGRVHVPLSGAPVETDTSYGIAAPNGITLYSNHDFNVSAPRRHDDVLGILRLLRRQGIKGIAWRHIDAPLGDAVLDSQGLALFARFARLQHPPPPWSERVLSRDPRSGSRDGWNVTAPRRVFLLREWHPTAHEPCVTLSDNSELWFVLGDPDTGRPRFYCPIAHHAA